LVNSRQTTTDAGCEQMIYKSEASELLAVEEAKSYLSGLVEKWKLESSK